MTDSPYDFADETAECESAEDFLDHFGIPYDRPVVQVYRLHILQRFHDYVAGLGGKAAGYSDYRHCLMRAYEDFVHSDARTEMVFSVFQRAAGIAKIPLTAIGRSGRA
jgi:nitrogenase-stabilizing/protective protein